MTEREKIISRIKKAEQLPKEELDKYRLEYDLLAARLDEIDAKEIKAEELTLIAVCILLGIRADSQRDAKAEDAVYNGLKAAFIDKKLNLGLGMIRAGIEEVGRGKHKKDSD